MSDLSPITALGASTPRSLSLGALTLAEDADMALATLARLGDAALPDLGVTLPGPMGLAQGRDCAAFWMAPDQWMFLWPARAAQDMAGDLAHRAPGCVVTDQTDGFACFHLDAPPALIGAALERLVNLDPARLSEGHATRIALHHQSVFVLRPAPGRLTLLPPRSGAGYLWDHLARLVARLDAPA